MTFARYWPAYLSAHRSRFNRRLHLVGTLAYMALLATLLITRQWGWLWTVLVVPYGFAWVGHFFVERNRPATFKHPFLSFIGDHKMAALMILGRLDAEMERLNLPQK